MKNYLVIAAMMVLAISCKSDSKNTKSTQKDNVTSTAKKFAELPALPEVELARLFNETTYIDYIFYNLPFSISQDDKPSINSNLGLISPERMGGINNDCKPIGREFFHLGGEIAYEAEIYFQEGCYGYVFMKNSTAVYANKISAEGMKFYNNIIAQARQITNQVQNGG